MLYDAYRDFERKHGFPLWL